MNFPKKYFLYFKYLSFVFLFIAVLTSCASLFYRPHFQSSEDRWARFPEKILGLHHESKIYWNDYAVPFIESTNSHDAAFLLGVVHAHLRWGQIEFIRLAAQGRLSEIGGPLATDIDHIIRIINFSANLESRKKLMSQPTLTWLEDYAKGLNYYIELQSELPMELRFAALEKKLWTVDDLLTIERFYAIDFSWITYLQYKNYEKNGQLDYFQKQLGGLEKLSISTPSFESIQNTSLIDWILHFTKTGSNSIVLGKSKTETGGGWIANDPHLGIFAPNFWLLAGLKSDQDHVVGLMVPGLPIFALGRNENIAWGGTNMRGISTHLYQIEETHLQIQSHEEEIKVRGWLNKKVKIRTSDKGPIISDSKYFKHPKPLVFQWVGHRPDVDQITTFLKISRAQNFQDFRTAFKTYGVSAQNFLYTDKLGNIGQVLAYKQLQFKTPEQLLKIIKSEDDYSDHILDSTELPYIYNPNAGFLASANNRPVETMLPLAFSYSMNDRIDRIQEKIQESNNWNLFKLQQLQQDTFSTGSKKIHNQMLSIISKFNADFMKIEKNFTDHENQIWQEFLSWDGFYNLKSIGAATFEIFSYYTYKDILNKIFNDPKMRENLIKSDRWKIEMLKFMQSLSPVELKEALLGQIKKAIKQSTLFKSWGDFHSQQFQHPLGFVPVIGGRYQVSEFPAPGSNETIYKSAHPFSSEKVKVSYGANSRHISDLGNLDSNYFVLLGGQDGWLMNPHISDQIELWNKGDYMKIPLKIESLQSSFKRVMIFKETH